jgi:hypothetical protein
MICTKARFAQNGSKQRVGIHATSIARKLQDWQSSLHCSVPQIIADDLLTAPETL